MGGRVVPWEISWRAVLGLVGCSFSFSSSFWGVVVVMVFTFEVAVGVAAGTMGSVIAEGAMVACYLGLTFGLVMVYFRAWWKMLCCRDRFSWKSKCKDSEDM
jgi:hypothetical protein